MIMALGAMILQALFDDDGSDGSSSRFRIYTN